MANTSFITIAGFTIKLFCKSGHSIALDEGFKYFITPENQSQSITEIEVIPGIPSELIEDNNLVFESINEGEKLWTVCKVESGYKITCFKHDQPNCVQQIAVLSNTGKNWKIYCEADSNASLTPLSYPMGPLVLYYLTTTANAVMIHSSGIFDGKKGRLFSGFSGVGKSTMAGLWQQNGCSVVNDDRMILTIENGKVMMQNTPMFYQDLPKVTELHAIYLLKQTKEHCIRRLNNAEAVSRLLAFCIQHGYDKDFLEHHLNTVFDIYNLIPIYELGFKLDADVIDFIRSHD